MKSIVKKRIVGLVVLVASIIFLSINNPIFALLFVFGCLFMIFLLMGMELIE